MESELIKEEWRDVIGYEGLYQVSSFGRVRGVDRITPKGHKWKGKILSPKDHNGYKSVTLSKNGRKKFYFVHRLVADAFIPNKLNYPIINHKDENPSNNCPDNLEWCTYKYNTNYGTCIDKVIDKQGNIVVMMDMNGNEIKEFRSVNEASRNTNSKASVISYCCRGLVYSSNGYRFKYKGDDRWLNAVRPVIKNSKTVLQYDLDGTFIKEWVSASEVERVLGYYASNICACCRGKHDTAYNYMWRYK